MVTASYVIHALHTFSSAPCSYFICTTRIVPVVHPRRVAELQFASSTNFRFGALDRGYFAHEHVGCLMPGTLGGHRNIIPGVVVAVHAQALDDPIPSTSGRHLPEVAS